MKNGKRLLSLFTAAAIAMSTFASVVIPASAADETTTLTPVLDTFVVTDGTTDNSAETELQVSNGGKVALIKFDASALKDKTITAADLSFKIASRAYNDSRNRWESSSIILATVAGDWEGSVTMADYQTMARTMLSDNVQWSNNDSATPSDGVAPYAERTFNVKDALVADDDGIITFAIYTGTGREQAVASMEDENNAPKLTVSTSTADTYTVTVKNTAGDKELATYTVENCLDGSTYEATSQQLGYKEADGVKYVPATDAVTSITVGKDSTVLDIPFVALDSSYALYEDFENIEGSWDFVSGDKSVPAVNGGVMNLTTFNNASSGTVADDTKVFGDEITSITKGNISFDYKSGVDATKNRISAFAVKDTNDKILIQLHGTGANGSLNSGITYSVGEALYENGYTGKGTLVEGSSTHKWYRVSLDVDFASAEHTVSGTISTTDGTAVATIPSTVVEASNIGKMAATIIYSLAPQYIDNVAVTYTEKAAIPEKYAITVPDTLPEDGTITVDKETAAEGEEVTITVAPADGKTAEIKVTAEDGTDVTVTDGKFTMPAQAVTVNVTFTAKPVEYNVTVAEGITNGTVTVDKAKAAKDATVTITATPADGYKLGEIKVTTGEGEAATVVEVAADNTFTMPEGDVKVTATFVENTPVVTEYNVTVDENIANGTVTVDKAKAEKDDKVTITATPAEGYKLGEIKVTTGEGETATAVEVAADNTFTMPEGDVTVTATFVEDKPVVDPTAVIDFTNRTLECEAKGNSTVFEITDAAAAGATALAAANAGNVLKIGANARGGGKMLGYKSTFAKDASGNTVVYGGQVTMTFKLEPMQIRTDKPDADYELSFADINGNKILPIALRAGTAPALTINGQAATGIDEHYGQYYNVTYTMDFDAKKASVKVDKPDGTNCLTVSDVDITAENITQIYRPDSDWMYGTCALDDIKIEATQVGAPVYYTIIVNTERYAKLTTSDNVVYYADVNGKVEIPLQKPGTAFDYTLSKVGYNNATGKIEALTADVEQTVPMEKSEASTVYIESEFGNANEAYVSIGGSRSDAMALGSIPLDKVSEVAVDFTFAGFGNNSGQQKTWFMKSSADDLVGIQISDNGIYAWTGWTGNADHNQSDDIGKFANGAQLSATQPFGDFTVKFVIDPANKAITAVYGDVSASLPYTIEATDIVSIGTGLYRYNGELITNEIRVTEPDPMYMTVNGAAKVAKLSGVTVTRQYTKTEAVITPDETFTWTLENAPEGVTIDENGLLSIADTATPGVVTVKATGTTGKTASMDVAIEDFQQMATFTADGPQSYDGIGKKGTYKLTGAVDGIGDDVLALIPAANVKWTSSDENVVKVDEATGEAESTGFGSATITATFTNGTAVSTVEIPAVVKTYSIVMDAAGDTTFVDMSDIVKDDVVTGYQVTTSKDGAVVKQYVVEKSAISASVAEKAAEKIVAKISEDMKLEISVTPVEEGAAVDLTAADGEMVFLWNSLNGMQPVNVIERTGVTVDTAGADKVEVAPVYAPQMNATYQIPAGTYNFVITANGRRGDVTANNQLLINNMQQYGSGTDDTVYANDVVLNEGYMRVSTADDQGLVVTGLTAVKAPENVKRKAKIYTLGDSLVAMYYGDGQPDNEDRITGWGQVLQNYISADYEVVDIANSGADTNGIKGDQMYRVAASGQAGDFMILESGYNDKGHSIGQDVLKANVKEMAEKAKAKGINVIIVTPNASAHDYNDSVAWSATMREAAEENGYQLIDLAKLSYNFLNDLYGAEFTSTDVRNKYNVYSGVNTGRTSENGLHSTFRAANCWAALVAQGLYDLGYKETANTEYSYTFNDGTNDVTVKVIPAAAE